MGGLTIGGALALLCATFSATSALELSNNIVYKSPSLNPRLKVLELDTNAIVERHVRARAKAKRDGSSDGDLYTGTLTFPYGVASGDPYNNSVILWTLASKTDLINGQWAGNTYPPIYLTYQVSTSGDFNDTSAIVTSGNVTTTWDVRFTAKVEATGLQPYTQYYYRWISAYGESLGASATGKFKTLPNEDDLPEQIRLATYSCSNYPFGFFNAYGAAANHSDTLDWIQHVGDYIYEYANGQYGDGTAINRIPQPLRECASLDDYRDRYATYRSDPDLMKLHQELAWQTVWDDHEVADQAYKAGTADSNNTIYGAVGGYEFNQRKANAVRAYFEWIPIRQVDTDDSLRIWRTFKVGKLFDLIMLDTRNYDRSITDLYYNTEIIRENAYDANRSMTGQAEQNWFLSQVDASSARGAYWRVIGQQVVFNRVNYTTATAGAVDFDFDDWEGYRYQRRQIVTHLQENDINNTVILSGDSHASWVFDITQDDYAGYNATSGEGARGVEFAGSAVSSPSSYGQNLPDSEYVEIAEALTSSNPSLQYAEGQLRGYFELTITPNNVSADYYGFYHQLTRNSNVTHMGTFISDHGTNRLRRPIGALVNSAFGSTGKGK